MLFINNLIQLQFPEWKIRSEYRLIGKEDYDAGPKKTVLGLCTANFTTETCTILISPEVHNPFYTRTYLGTYLHEIGHLYRYYNSLHTKIRMREELIVESFSRAALHGYENFKSPFYGNLLFDRDSIRELEKMLEELKDLTTKIIDYEQKKVVYGV
jgi:hypothetical protein